MSRKGPVTVVIIIMYVTYLCIVTHYLVQLEITYRKVLRNKRRKHDKKRNEEKTCRDGYQGKDG